MKKALLITNVLTIVLLYFSAFKTADKKEVNYRTDAPPSCNPICTNYLLNPIEGISTLTAKSMANIYRSKQWAALNENHPDFLDSRSVWFSLDKIKSFIAEAESRTCDSACDKKLNLGIRIYEGAYPDLSYMETVGIKARTGFFDVKNEYGKHLTLFMVPTYYDDANNSQVDFNPRNIGPNKCKPIPLKLINDRKTVIDKSALSEADQRALLKLNIAPGDSANPVKRSGIVAGAIVAPSFKNALILSAIEKQTFNTPVNTAARGVTSIINHGNTIPPDVDNGAAF